MADYIPPEYAAQLAELQRRQALSQALLQQAIAPRPTETASGGIAVRRHPLEFLGQLGTAYLANQGAANAGKEMQAIQSQIAQQEAEQLKGLYSSDPKQGLAQFLAAQNPRVREAARELAKQYQEQRWKVLQASGDAAKDRGDTTGAISIYTGDLEPNAYKPAEFPQPEVKPLEVGGKPFVGVTNYDKYGRPQMSVTAPGTSVEVNTNAKLGQKLVEQDLEATAPGKGELWKKAAGAQKSLIRIAQAVGQLEEGAQSGSLEPYVQVARNIGEYLGIPNAATAPTATLSALLKARVLDEQGGLGVAISDADRQFFQEASGDLTTNPEALLRLSAISAYVAMQDVAGHNKFLESLKETTELNPKQLDARKVPLRFQVPKGAYGERLSKMIQNVAQGLPTTAGLPPLVQQGPSSSKKLPTPADENLPPGVKRVQ